MISTADPSFGTTVAGENSLPAPRRRALELLIIIINYRTPQLTIGCLESLEAEVRAAPRTRVVVVDNCSGDGSDEKLAAAIRENGWQEWVTLRVTPRNGGFAYGNNRGWETARDAEYVLLLNSDTIVHAGCLRHCLEVMERQASVGALGCLVQNPDGSVQNPARRFATVWNQLAWQLGLVERFPRAFQWADLQDPSWDRRTTKRDVGWLGGAFMFLRGEMLRKIGLLDEEFFFYGEDIEFCHRVWRSGYRVHFDPGASITHLGGASSDPTRLREQDRTMNRWLARYTVQLKCHGRWAAHALRAIDLTGYLARVAWMWATGQSRGPQYVYVKGALANLLKVRLGRKGRARP